MNYLYWNLYFWFQISEQNPQELAIPELLDIEIKDSLPGDDINLSHASVFKVWNSRQGTCLS